MLGTRDPELLDPHASTGYLIWLDDKARIIIDTGPGTVQNFTKSGTNYEDVQLMLFTHFNGNRSADFAAYIKGCVFSKRTNRLNGCFCLHYTGACMEGNCVKFWYSGAAKTLITHKKKYTAVCIS